MIWILRIGIGIVISTFFNSIGWQIPETNIPTLFSVLGIMMPLALSLGISIRFDDMDDSKLKEFKANIEKIIQTFVWIFAITTIIFAKPYPDKQFSLGFINTSLYKTADYFIGFAVIYYCINFMGLLQIRIKISKRKKELEKESAKIDAKISSINKEYTEKH